MTDHPVWAIVPAAGIGKRMRSDVPKQYLELNGRPVLEYTLNTLLDNDNIAGLVISLQADDAYFPSLQIHSDKPLLIAPGGKERVDSVMSALQVLLDSPLFDNAGGWVMVHDAVRACLRQQDIDKLVQTVAGDENGGLLALPVRDTMKRRKSSGDDDLVGCTVDRENLWHALTPQYFPALPLLKSLKQAIEKGVVVTDESSAMEAAGFSPHLVSGFEDNIKITRPEDLHLASLYLTSQQNR